MDQYRGQYRGGAVTREKAENPQTTPCRGSTSAYLVLQILNIADTID